MPLVLLYIFLWNVVILYASVRGGVSRLSLSSGHHGLACRHWLTAFFIVCLHMPIFGGKFNHNWCVAVTTQLGQSRLTCQLWPKLKLNWETLPLTEATKQHVADNLWPFYKFLYTIFLLILTATVSMSSSIWGRVLTVVSTSLATCTTFTFSNFCPADTSPHTGRECIVMDAKRGALKTPQAYSYLVIRAFLEI